MNQEEIEPFMKPRLVLVWLLVGIVLLVAIPVAPETVAGNHHTREMNRYGTAKQKTEPRLYENVPPDGLYGPLQPQPQTQEQECLAQVDKPFPPNLSGLRYGINAFLFQTDTARVLDLIENAGFAWVRQQIHWRDIEGERGQFNWEPLDKTVAATRKRDLHLLLSIVRSPSWATEGGDDGLPDDLKAFANFLHTLATRYRGQVAAYEVWNEPNLSIENGGTPATPEQYLGLLKVSYSAIKSANPCALVLAAPLSPTTTNHHSLAADDMEFYERLYALDDGAFKWAADIVAMHPGGGSYHPMEGWSVHQPHRSRYYFRHIEQVYNLMQRNGDNRQVWITEVGWTVVPIEGAPLPVTLEQQAEYLVEALAMTRDYYPWVSAIFVWNLNFGVIGLPDDEKTAFGILNKDWSPRPSYLALQLALHENQWFTQ
jgi:polysaccharide biosynthesis protein PslG